MKKSSPNIVFICVDQLSAKALSFYGGKVSSTPVLAELASEAALFARYYASHPVCAPNRATMLTGRSSVIHGVVSNNLVLPGDIPTYIQLLKGRGYRTGGFGKFHQTPMMTGVPTELSWLGFDEAVVTEDPKWGPYIDWLREKHPSHYEAALAATNGHSGSQGPGGESDRLQGATEDQIRLKKASYDNYMRPRIADSPWERMYPSCLPAEAHDSVFITEKAVEFINKVDPWGEPFYCHVSYVDPHDPYDPPEPYASLFSPSDMEEPLPATWRDEGCDALEREYFESYLNFRKIDGNPEAVARLRALYHGSLKLLDDQIGMIVHTLKVKELWENTILVFTSDHGELLGDHGFVAKGIPHFDGCIRCPLIIGGGAVKQASLQDSLISSLDLFPSLCELAQISGEDLPPLEGQSFAGLLDEKSREKTEADLSVRGAVRVSIDDAETIITSDSWRYTFYAKTGESLLYSLQNDPGEQENLAAGPEYREKRDECRELLIREMNRPQQIPAYRNLSYHANKRYSYQFSRREVYPHFALKASPWISSTRKNPEWKGYPRDFGTNGHAENPREIESPNGK